MVNFVWTVVNLDNTLSNSTIQSWIGAAGMPSCFRFVFQSPFANAWVINTAYSGSAPIPLAPWTILVSSATHDPRFKWTVSGLAIGGGLHQASIGYWDFDAPAELGARMWHEILHCYDIPADNMQTSERDGFIEYLRITGSVHYAGFSQDPNGYERNSQTHTQILIAFYNYLTHKYFECECFRMGCSEQSSVPQDSGSTPSLETSDADREEMMKKLMYAGAIVAGLLLIF